MTTSTAPRTRRSPWLAVLSGLVCAAGVVGAGIAGVLSAIVWSGCFLSCTGEDHASGALLALLAALSLASGPAAVSGLYRSARWMRAAVTVFVVAACLLLVALAYA